MLFRKVGPSVLSFRGVHDARNLKHAANHPGGDSRRRKVRGMTGAIVFRDRCYAECLNVVIIR